MQFTTIFLPEITGTAHIDYNNNNDSCLPEVVCLVQSLQMRHLYLLCGTEQIIAASIMHTYALPDTKPMTYIQYQ